MYLSGVEPDLLQDIVLLNAELLANAIEAGSTEVKLKAEPFSNPVVISVSNIGTALRLATVPFQVSTMPAAEDSRLCDPSEQRHRVTDEASLPCGLVYRYL